VTAYGLDVLGAIPSRCAIFLFWDRDYTGSGAI